MVDAWFTREQFLAMVTAGEMPDDASLAAYALLTLWEGKKTAS